MPGKLRHCLRPDYAAVLADMEAKKLALESGITSLRAAIGTGVLSVPVGMLSGGIPAGAFSDKSAPTAIKLYLATMGRRCTAKQITEGLRQGGVESRAKSFDAIVYAALRRLKLAGEVLQSADGWGLSEWYHQEKVSG